MGDAHLRALKKVPLFSELSDHELSGLARLARLARYEAREHVFEQGDESGDLFVVLTGRLKVVSLSLDAKESILGFENPGDVIGEIALLDGKPRSASVVALEPSELLVLERRAVLAFLASAPEVSIKLLAVMAGRLRRLSLRVEDVAFRPIPERLARRLLQLCDEFGEKLPSGSVRIGMRLSQQELGESIDATRESVNKHLRAWEQQGLLSQDAGAIEIRSPEALRALYMSDEL